MKIGAENAESVVGPRLGLVKKIKKDYNIGGVLSVSGPPNLNHHILNEYKSKSL